MPIVSLTQVGKSFGAERIFSGISFQIDPQDRIGLVGPNGAGKSTLLNILAGREEADEGTLSIGRNIRIGYLTQTADFQPQNTLREEMLTVFAEIRAWEQELNDLAQELASPAALADTELHEQLLAQYAELQTRFEHAGGYTYENRVAQVLDGLGFSREQQEAPVTQLSGGQQTRAALGKLLLQEPDLLLLDEPTNHLDLEALEWLETYLTGWKGALVVVAHDRYFLDKVVSRTIELAFGRIEEYPGNYSKYLRLREERMERRQREYEAQQAHIAHTEEFIRRYKAGQRSREARGRQKLLDRLERVERPQDFPEMHFEFTPVVNSGETVLSTQKLAVGYRNQPTDGQTAEPDVLVRVADLELLRGDVVGLIGPNGAGKTTLLRTIIGELSPLSGQVNPGHNVRIGYYSQTHAGLNPESTMLDEILQVTTLTVEGVRSFLGRFLFSGDDVFKTIGTLSGGERSRVALAKLTLQGSNFLVLDEPTNHLDLQSRQFLEEVLSEFEGTLLFVSHDRYFIDSLATKLWVIEEGGVLIPYYGNYTDYRTRKRPIVLDIPEPAKPGGNGKGAPTATKTVAAPVRTSHKKAAKVKVRSVEDVERDIEKAEERVKTLEEALSAAALKADAAQLTQLSTEYDQARAHVDELLAEWERLLEAESTS